MPSTRAAINVYLGDELYRAWQQFYMSQPRNSASVSDICSEAIVAHMRANGVDIEMPRRGPKYGR